MQKNGLPFEIKLVQQRLTTAISAVGFGVWDWDIESNELIWDDQMLKIFGLERSQFKGTAEDWKKTLLPEDADRAWLAVELALKGEKEFDVDFRIRRLNDGSIRSIRGRASVLRDETGRAIRFIGCNWDVTDQLRAEYQANMMLRLVEGSRDLYGVFSMEGEMIFMNESARLLWTQLGRKPKRIQDWFGSESINEFMSEAMPALLSGKSWEREVGFWRSDLQRSEYFWFRAMTISERSIVTETEKNDIERKMIALIGTNVTDRRQVEAKLIHASKMVTIGEMAGGVAHEINNPLGVILVRSQLLRRKISAGRADLNLVVDDLMKIEETAMRIAKIVQSLKTFSKESGDEPTVVVAVLQIVEDTLDLCGERMRKQKVDIRVRVPSATKLRGRPNQLSEVLLNLIQNAFDAVVGQPDAWIEIACDEMLGPKGKVVITVTDSGTGIPESVSRRMMEPFFTTKEINQGTGLGLSVSKGIVEAHGGELRYDPSFLHTRFVIELPKAS